MAVTGEVDLRAVAGAAAGRAGAVWTLDGGEDLNANLVRFPGGGGVGEHVNDEVDVVFIGVSGAGTLAVDGDQRSLRPGCLILVPKGARRATRAAPEGLAYLTVHKRRGPVRIGRR